MASDDGEKTFQERVEEALAAGLPMPNFPESTPIDSLAMAQNEVCGTFEKHGFSRKESLYLTAAMFSGNPGQAPGD